MSKSSLRRYVILRQTGMRPGHVTGIVAAQSHAEAKNLYEIDLLMLQEIGVVVDMANEDQRRFIELDAIEYEDPATGKVFTCNEGGRIWYIAAGEASTGRVQGKGAAWAFLDEYSWLFPTFWDDTVRPMLADYPDSRALIIGTPIPDAPNFAGYADLWEMGNPENPLLLPGQIPSPGVLYRFPGYASFTGVSEENPEPNISHEEIRAQRAELIAKGRGAVAACIYDGRFVTDLGAVFQNLDTVFSLPYVEVEPGLWAQKDRRLEEDEAVSIGIDFGRHDDATVLVAFSTTSLDQLALQRIHKVDYPSQMPLIKRFTDRFPRRVIWSEGREQGAADLLQKQYGQGGVNLVSWSGTGPMSKIGAVTKGMDLCDRGAWRMLNLRWVKEEFRQFSRAKSTKGNWTYDAPKGKHDDAVAACLFAAQFGLPLTPIRRHLPAIDVFRVDDPWRDMKDAKGARETHPFVLRSD